MSTNFYPKPGQNFIDFTYYWGGGHMYIWPVYYVYIASRLNDLKCVTARALWQQFSMARSRPRQYMVNLMHMRTLYFHKVIIFPRLFFPSLRGLLRKQQQQQQPRQQFLLLGPVCQPAFCPCCQINIIVGITNCSEDWEVALA